MDIGDVFKPTLNRVVVQRIQPPETDGKGIIIPDNREIPVEARVVAVGPNCEAVHVGDRVLMSQRAGGEARIDGQECVILWEYDVLGVLRDG